MHTIIRYKLKLQTILNKEGVSLSIYNFIIIKTKDADIVNNKISIKPINL